MNSDGRAVVVEDRELEHDDYARLFQGHRHANTGISFILVDMPPGGRVRLHRHAYREIFIVQEGEATFTAGPDTLVVRAPRVVIVPAGVPHAFANTGDVALRQVDIHLNERTITEWLE